MHLGILHLEDVPPEFFREFQGLVDTDGLSVEYHSRRNSPFAGIEWLIPTAVVLFVTRAYFDAFLKEAGKDHYAALKAGVKSLWKRLRPVKATVIASPGKAAPDQPYSLIFSVVVEVGEGASMKLLIDNELSGEEADAAIEALLVFAELFLTDALSQSEIEILERANVVGRTLLLAYNGETGRVEPMDPMTRRFPSADAPVGP